VTNLFDKAIQSFGRVDAVFANAADLSKATHGRDTDMLEAPMEVFDRCIAVNITSRSDPIALITSVTQRKIKMRIVVDLNKCQAYAQCCFLAPDVFEMHGQEALLYNPQPDDRLREDVRRAQAACPVQAIIAEFAELEAGV
jgi:ferredoxin